MTESQKLLAAYARDGSETAFRELVTRYVDLVYSVAVRLTNGDTHRAQDVTQAVFVELARKAGTLSREVMLGGWLHRHTCYVAANVLRGERRRQQRERQAAEMNTLEDHSEANLAQVAPILDEAINELGAEDRTAILLRFFEQRDLRSVGEALGGSENAAQKRVARALEELRGMLKRRGVALSVTALGTALTTEAVTAAPAGLAAGISSTTLAAVGAGTGTSTTLLKLMAMTKLQTGIITAIVVAGVATPLMWHQQQVQNQLRTENGALHQQVGQYAGLASENARLSNALAQTKIVAPPSSGQSEELLRLRAEVTRMKGNSAELAQLKASEAGKPVDPAATEMKSWLGRVNQLKQRMEQVPGQKVPEMQLLTEMDWLNAAKGPLETDEDYRRAMAALRMAGANKFAGLVRPALRDYLKEHNFEFPTDLSQLQSYLKTPADAALFQNFTIMPASAVPNVRMSGDWIITQKTPVDSEYDSVIVIGPSGYGSTDYKSLTTRQDNEMTAAMKALAPAREAFSTANNGKELIDMAQLQPYLKSPEEQFAFRKLMEKRAALEKAAESKKDPGNRATSTVGQ